VTLRIAHLSDIHFGGEHEPAVAATFDCLAADPPDLTVISGDLTVAGAAAEFEAAAEWTAALRATGAPLLIIPGNHDVPELDIPLRLTNPWGRWRAAFGPPDGVGVSIEGLEVVGFNTARAVQARMNWSKGAVSARQVRAVTQRLARAPADTLRIAACHHPLVELPDGPMTARVWGGALAAQRLAEARTDLVLSGHIHAPFVMAYPYGDGETQAVGASTLSERERGVPVGFNMIEADMLEIRVTALAYSGSGLAPWNVWTVPRRKAHAGANL
jgi:3',5'-cyclic AMP phosphodiesterase CpdA